MSKLKHVIHYFVQNYPYSDELSKTRITKMVYLADWFSAIENENQITDIVWYFDHYGPYVGDVYEAAQNDSHLLIKEALTPYGSPKEVITFKDEKHLNFFEKLGVGEKLNDKDKKILKKVIEETELLTWNSFIDLVYSTYPIRSQHRYSFLNLVELAKKYKSLPNQDKQFLKL
jgi:hypothetical protein